MSRKCEIVGGESTQTYFSMKKNQAKKKSVI